MSDSSMRGPFTISIIPPIVDSFPIVGMHCVGGNEVVSRNPLVLSINRDDNLLDRYTIALQRTR